MSTASSSFLRVPLNNELSRLFYLIVLIGLTGFAFFPNHKVAGQSDAVQSCPTCKPPSAQIIYTPLITPREATYAEINLNCRSPHPIDAVPTFYTTEGTPVVGETIHLLPAEMRFVDVQSLIPQTERGRRDWGGMSLSYAGNTMEVWAQMTFHGVGKKESVNSLFAVVEARRSDVREAVWHMPKNAAATIAVGNYSDAPAAATLTFSNGDVEQINLAPYATKVVERKNNGQNRIESESAAITSSGQSGRVITTGFVSSKDDFASSIRFTDTENVAQPNLYATNFRLKNTTPRIVLKNTTTSAVTARPRFIPMSGEGGGVVELPALTIQPNAVREVNLNALTNAARARADLDSVSVQIINSSATGSLIGAANFTSDTTGIDYDIPLKDSGTAQNSAGGYPVRLDGNYTTNLSITNVGDKAGQFTLQVNFNGGFYAMYPRELAPGETAAFDFRRIRDERIPDSSGKVLPLNLTVAQIRWSMIGRAQTRMMGRSEIVSKSGRVSSSYSRFVCCRNSYHSSRLTPDQVFAALGDELEFTAKETDSDCYGGQFYEYPVLYPTWSSSDTSVADFYNFGTSTATATALDVGDVQISAMWDANYSIDNGSEGCMDIPMTPAPIAYMEIAAPSVSISSFKAVGKNQTATIRITVGNNPNNQDIALTLYPSPGTGQAQFTTTTGNSDSRTIQQTTDVEIKGITESSTNNNMRLEATYTKRNNQIGTLDTEDFTVISVTLSLRFDSNDDISADNDKKQNHITSTGRSKLGGPFFVTGTGNKIWGHSIEIVGTVSPNNYSGDIVLQREVVESRSYQGMTFLNSLGCIPSVPTPCSDTSFASFLDATVSSQGHIFDLDNPGFDLVGATTVGTIRRRRTNFRQWATVSQNDAGTTKDVRVSEDITWFQRLSVKYVGLPATQLSYDVSNDNEIGSGTTPLTWNLMP